MLPYALAIAVGLSSSFLFLTAFFFKDIHRPDDFFWSTIGLFYALVLWFCATGITGAVLLGQLAVVALLTAYIWQTIKLRDAIANPEKQADLDSFSVMEFLKNRLMQSPVKLNPNLSNPTETVTPDKSIVTKIEEPQQAVTETKDTEIKDTAIANTTETNVATSDTKNEEESTPETTSALVETNSEKIVPTESEITDNSPESQTQSSTEESNNLPVEEFPTEDVSTDGDSVTTEIAVEKVTIVEEETNWDDEVEDVSFASVTVVEEVSDETPATTIESSVEEITEESPAPSDSEATEKKDSDSKD